jgi:hypothetical protein
LSAEFQKVTSVNTLLYKCTPYCMELFLPYRVKKVGLIFLTKGMKRQIFKN